MIDEQPEEAAEPDASGEVIKDLDLADEEADDAKGGQVRLKGGMIPSVGQTQ